MVYLNSVKVELDDTRKVQKRKKIRAKKPLSSDKFKKQSDSSEPTNYKDQKKLESAKVGRIRKERKSNISKQKEFDKTEHNEMMDKRHKRTGGKRDNKEKNRQ